MAAYDLAKLIGDYTKAFRAANPNSPAPDLRYERGWMRFYSQDGMPQFERFRPAKLIEMTDRLRARVTP